MKRVLNDIEGMKASDCNVLLTERKRGREELDRKDNPFDKQKTTYALSFY